MLQKSRIGHDCDDKWGKSRFYHTGNLITMNLSLNQKHRYVIDMLEKHKSEGNISNEQFEAFKKQLEAKNYRNNLSNDFDCYLTMEYL